MTKVYSQQSVLTGRKRKMSVEMGHFAVVDLIHRWFLYTGNYGSSIYSSKTLVL